MTWVFGGMTAAELAASGLAAGTAAGAGVGTAGAGALGAGLAGGGLAAAEGLGAGVGEGALGAGMLEAPTMPALAEMPAAESGGGMLSNLPGMNLPGANPMEPPGLESLPNPMELLGGGGSAPPPMPEPVMPQPVGSPPTPKIGQSFLNKENMKMAHDALTMASKLIKNPKDKQTVGLMRLSTGLAASGGDLSGGNMNLISGPLSDIAAGTEEAQPQQQPQAPKRLSDMRAPSTQQQPGPIAKAIPWLPPTKIYG